MANWKHQKTRGISVHWDTAIIFILPTFAILRPMSKEETESGKDENGYIGFMWIHGGILIHYGPFDDDDL